MNIDAAVFVVVIVMRSAGGGTVGGKMWFVRIKEFINFHKFVECTGRRGIVMVRVVQL